MENGAEEIFCGTLSSEPMAGELGEMHIPGFQASIFDKGLLDVSDEWRHIKFLLVGG